MRKVFVPVLLVLAAGCNDDESSDTIPAGAAALQSYAQAGAALALPGVSRFDSLLPFLANPGSPGASGIVLQPDPTPGAPPHSYVFTVSLDGDGDGATETSLTGGCTLSDDPANAGPGFGGTVNLDIDSEGGLGDFTGTIAFTLTDQGTRLSGTGAFSETVLGNTTTFEVDAADPLLLDVPAAGGTANACAYTLDGNLGVDVAGPSGSLSSLWNFVPGQRSVQVTNASYVDPDSTRTDLPNSSFEIPCGGGSLSDWAGVFLQDWSCFPPEYGQARLTITVTGANTITIVDRDPPDDPTTSSYAATADPGRPHVVRGHFIAGDTGSAYREDFTWTLAADGGSFTQVSAYVYQEGPNQGTGGICAGSATREP